MFSLVLSVEIPGQRTSVSSGYPENQRWANWVYWHTEIGANGFTVQGKTKLVLNCKNRALQDWFFCSVHSDRLDVNGLGDALIGAAIGQAILPGLGGIIGGTVAGRFSGKELGRKEL